MQKTFCHILILALCVFTLVGCTEQPAAKGPAPEIKAGAWLNSEPLTLAALKGKIAVIEFWATWCPPCRQSIPHLAKMHQEYKDKGVVMISLSNENLETVKPFAEKNGMTWPLGIGSNSGTDYGVQGIPKAFIVGKDGTFLWSGHPMNGLEEALKAAVEAK
jgi:thiol-disulfide isomerase/thioredoxin